jgi:broad specificity phosphatase PhoE
MSAVTATGPAVTTGADAVRVLMLRHGQSEWNAVRRWQGSADSPLTSLGREQAIETAWTLAGLPPFSALWASDLSRALETAAIIGDALGLGTPRVDPRLREAHAGEWEGMTPDEIEARWPGWLADHRRPPSFEPYHEVVDRTLAALDDAVTSAIAGHGGTGAAAGPAALVVTHSGVIRSVIRHLGRHDDRVPNLGGAWLRVESRTASAAPHRSVADGRRIELLDLFDPAGIVISGIDAPGEDPGDEPDEADAHRRTEH